MKWFRSSKAGKAVLYGSTGLLLVIFLLLFVYPSPIDPVSWSPPVRPEATGIYAENRLLNDADLLAGGQLQHPEDIVFDAEGRLYTGTGDGKVYRISLDDEGEVADLELFAELEGRPLGLKFDSEGSLIAAVPEIGLVSIDREGNAALLTNRVGDSPIRFADHLDIAKDGTIYFSDASTKFTSGWPYDALEGKPHGRILSYDPASKETKVLLDGMYFANGVALSPDEDYMLITESFRYRITKYWLQGTKQNTTEVFADNLPILPDNLSIDDNGDYWTGGSVRGALLDWLHTNAFVKQQLAKLPYDYLRNIPSRGNNRTGYIIQFSPDGQIKMTYQDPDGRVSNVSAVVRRGDDLYIGTLYGDAVSRYSLRN